MSEMLRSMFKKVARPDGLPGYVKYVPTTMAFVEADGTDKRMQRMYVYDEGGVLVQVFLVDPMGVRWADLPDVVDDYNFKLSE